MVDDGHGGLLRERGSAGTGWKRIARADMAVAHGGKTSGVSGSRAKYSATFSKRKVRLEGRREVKLTGTLDGFAQFVERQEATLLGLLAQRGRALDLVLIHVAALLGRHKVELEFEFGWRDRKSNILRATPMPRLISAPSGT